MKQFDIITIFPEIVDPYVQASILGRAQSSELISIQTHDLREYTDDKHRRVDDTTYGGGAGMLMKVEPFDRALAEIKKEKKSRVILTAASGKPFTQKDAMRLAADYDQIIFLCGRYEGIDYRVEENLVDEVFSVGSYVLTGGELPAMTMTDAISRMVPGVVQEESLKEESHTEEGVLEYPQYTKPEEYNGWKVPEVLLNGNHKLIEGWREEHSKKQ